MTTVRPVVPPKDRKYAMILSGGGARGAYEVGVLWYIFDEFARLRRKAPKVDILCGTSVGAINACYLAAHMSDTALGMRRLVHLWSELELAKVLGFGMRQVLSLPKLVMGGGGEGTGIFDVRPMAELVQREISWRALSRTLRRRKLRALTVSCTEVATGRTVVFIQTAPHLVISQAAPPRTLFRLDHIGPHHALASAAIPMLFPPVRIDSELYLDGGLRQNTPIAPALRLGATHVFAIGLSREVQGIATPEGAIGTRGPGAAFLLGKVLNAFLLDHVDVDMDFLERMNAVLRDGTSAYGDTFLEAMTREAARRNAPAYRYVETMAIRPSEDIGHLASDHVKRGKFLGNPLVTKKVLSILDIGAGNESDLASYLLFDGQFCQKLIEMGRADAHARREQLFEFFGDGSEQSDDPDDPLDGDPGKGSLPMQIGT
jgi:NTE family protein